jgi:hypothetical protein
MTGWVLDPSSRREGRVQHPGEVSNATTVQVSNSNTPCLCFGRRGAGATCVHNFPAFFLLTGPDGRDRERPAFGGTPPNPGWCPCLSCLSICLCPSRECPAERIVVFCPFCFLLFFFVFYVELFVVISSFPLPDHLLLASLFLGVYPPRSAPDRPSGLYSLPSLLSLIVRVASQFGSRTTVYRRVGVQSVASDPDLATQVRCTHTFVVTS